MTALALTAPPEAPANAPRFIEGLVTAARLGEAGRPMLEVAVALAEAGWPVFPCGQDKAPLVPGGFKARSTDPQRIKQWWLTHPDALPAIVPGDGDLAALDVDSTAAAAVVDAAGYLRENGGFVVATGGTSEPFNYGNRLWHPMHVYVRATEEPKLPGVVVRFRSGYVIAPGARRGERVYRVASSNEPAAWTGDLKTNPAPQATADSRSPQQAPDIERVRQAVDRIPNTAETDRNQYVAMAHMIHGAAGEGGRDVFLDWAARYPGVVDSVEDARLFDTITKPRTGWSELWHVAAAHDFDATSERQAEAQSDFEPLADEPVPTPATTRSLHARLASIREHLAGVRDPLEKEIMRAELLGRLSADVHLQVRILERLLAAFDAPHRTLKVSAIRPGPDLRDAIAAAPPDAIVPGYLQVQGQHLLFGEPGTFKTFVALDLGLHVASGLPWLGRIPVQRGGVVFFAGEAAPRLNVRIAAWCAARGLSVEQARGLPFTLIDCVPTLGVGEDGLHDALARIRAASDRPLLLVFDNMTRIAGQSQLSIVDPSELGGILAGLDTLARQTGAGTLTICHSPLSDQSKVAGSYPIVGNPDVILQSVRGGALTTKLTSTKVRDGAAVQPLVLTLQPQDVREWLRSSYQAGKQPIPPTLEVTDFDNLPVGAQADGGTGSGMSRRLASLVIASGRSPLEVTTAPADDETVSAAVGDTREWVRRVLAAHPTGLSKTAMRERVGGSHARLDAVLAELEDEDIITVRRGRQHVYRLAGPAGVEAGAPTPTPRPST